MHDLPNPIGNHLRALRESLRVSITTVADRSGYDRTMVYHLETHADLFCEGTPIKNKRHYSCMSIVPSMAVRDIVQVLCMEYRRQCGYERGAIVIQFRDKPELVRHLHRLSVTERDLSYSSSDRLSRERHEAASLAYETAAHLVDATIFDPRLPGEEG